MTHRILLADDSVTIRKVVELTFSDEDFTIDSVGDGAQAFEHARAQRPDIIISDVIMPGLNGYELCQQVKSDPNLRSVPFLLLKGTFETFDEEKARSCGADGFIVKPFESQEMIAKVRDLIGRVGQAPPVAPVQQPQRAMEPPPAPAVAPVAPRPMPTAAEARPVVPQAVPVSVPARPHLAPPSLQTPPAPRPVPTSPIPPTIPATAASPAGPRPVVPQREAVAATPGAPQRPVMAPPPIPAMPARPVPIPPAPAPPIPSRPIRPIAVAPPVGLPVMQPTPRIHVPPSPPPPAPLAPAPPIAKAAIDDFGFDFGESEGDRFGDVANAPAAHKPAAPALEPSAESDEDLWSEVSLRGNASDLLEERAPAGSEAEPGSDIVELAEEAAITAPDILFEDEAVFEEVSTALRSPVAFPGEQPAAREETPEPIAPAESVSSEPAAPISIDQAEIERIVASRVETAVRKILEPLVSELARTMIEAVAWEVIPDLAEAMIRGEIERIRQANRTD